jgi:hypothetical protein
VIEFDTSCQTSLSEHPKLRYDKLVDLEMTVNSYDRDIGMIEACLLGNEMHSDLDDVPKPLRINVA